jgi:hypothetical protein
MDVARETHIKLDEVWTQLQDMPKAGVARTSIIHCQSQAARAQRPEHLFDPLIVVNAAVLSQLEDDARNVAIAERSRQVPIEHNV